MADLLELIPVFQESLATIRARMDADVNAGLLSNDDPRWMDTREGTFYWDTTQVFALEMARLWDALSVEVVAACSPLFAWGSYLDRWAEVFDLERKEAVAASGSVQFVGDQGTLVATGTVVSAEPVSEDADVAEFATIETGTIAAPLDPTGIGTPTFTPSASGGTLASGDYTYWITALNAYGETEAGFEQTVTVVGPAGSVAIDWANVTGATLYRVYRGTDAVSGLLVYEGATSAFTDTGGAGGVVGPPEENATAGVTLLVVAVDAGADGNVSALAVTSLESPTDGILSVINREAMAGGKEPETDEELRERILAEFAGKGTGTIAAYTRQALSRAGVGEVHVIPNYAGAGTVRVVIMDGSGNAVPTLVLEDVQGFLDPVPGEGKGEAPVGASVDVATNTMIDIDVAAAVTFLDGFSLDGAAGTTALRAAIEQAITEYIDGLPVGGDVIYNHILAQFFRVPGVLNVTGLTVNGAATNVAIAESPPETARTDAITLT